MRRIAAFAAVLLLAAFSAGTAISQTLFSADDILRVSPRADPALVQALVDNQPILLAAGIDTRLRVAFFLAQVMTETGGLRRLDENMNYSAKRLTEVFSKKVITTDKAAALAGLPNDIANWVYRNRLGNGGPETGDGWAFRGSGYIQLTGRTNFRLRGEEIGLPLEEQPDLAREPVEGLKAATAYWTSRRINDAADLNDRRGVRRLVNGPRMEGLDQSILWFNKIWTGVYRDRAPFPGEAAGLEAGDLDPSIEGDEALERILIGVGATESGAFEAGGDNAAAVEQALTDFQASRALPETGVLDEDTFYALTDPSEWRTFETADFAALPSEGENDAGVAHDLAGSGTETSATATLEPEEGTGMTENASLDIEELTALADAGGSYSLYESAEGRYEGGNFIPHTVIGEDEREVVLDTTAFPARAIVQILFRKREGLGQYLCTGAMVAPDLVLTAGHCVHGGTSAGRWYTEFDLFPGRNTQSKPFGACKATQLYALQGWTTATLTSEARLYDLGAIRLDCDVGRRTGWFGVTALPEDAIGQPTAVQGYAADKEPPGRQWLSLDEVRLVQSEKGFYENDTFGGTSGSPVFVGGDASRIVCVHTNGLHGSGPWAKFNACTRITPARLATIAGWIGED